MHPVTEARALRPLGTSELRGVRSNSVCGVVKLGADGPARRSSSVSRAYWLGPPPIPRRGPPRATNRMTRSSRRSPSRGAACGFWIRAWGQREPALQGTGRLSSPAPVARLHKGGLDITTTNAHLNSCCIEHPIRTLTRCAWSSAGRVGTLRLVQLLPPLLKGRGAWFINALNKTLAAVPFPPGMIARSLRPQIRVEHERSGVVTADDQFRRALGLSR